MTPSYPTGPFGVGLGAWVNVSAIVGLASVLVALAIVAKAVRGYRQRGSRPMLLLAVGLVFVALVPRVYEFGLLVWLGRPETGSGAVIRMIGEELLRLVGLLSILASLYVDR